MTMNQPQAQAQAQAARVNPVAPSQSWRILPADFYSFRHTAKHLSKPTGMSNLAFKKAKVAARNDLHIQLDLIRAANVCRVETSLECWLRELADLRARVRQADTHRARGIEFRPLFMLSLTEMEIAAQIAAAAPAYFAEQYQLDPSSFGNSINMVKHVHKPGLNDR